MCFVLIRRASAAKKILISSNDHSAGLIVSDQSQVSPRVADPAEVAIIVR